MRQLGDVTRINGAEIEPVDVITFGSPCQDLSIAGKQAGLDGERSGLFFEAVRIIKEMREATNNERPTFAIWENVPGALSSAGGEDFRAVLQALAAIAGETVSIPRPSGRWLTAGEIVGDGYSIDWRILDSQYWGVPQRRRRIYLVADFGGHRASEILFDRSRLPRHFGAGRVPGQAAAADVGGGAAQNCVTPWDVQSRRIYMTSGGWPALYSGEGGGRGYVMTDTVPIVVRRLAPLECERLQGYPDGWTDIPTT